MCERSCQQWDIWEAVFGPKAADGYPARLWCKDPAGDCVYGEINQTVLKYWLSNWDLTARVKAEWVIATSAT